MSVFVEQMAEVGGVDSRSNPLAFPRNRALRMKNWAPQDSGVLQLRYGFTSVSMSTVSGTSYHDLIPFSLYDASGNETRYLILGQGTATMQLFNVGTGAVTTPAVRGAAFAANNKGSYYAVNNHIYYGNGADQKWTDGVTWRQNGIRQLASTELANVLIVSGLPELTATERSTATVTAAASGSFSVTTQSGYLFYASKFDSITNEIGPATLPLGSGSRLTIGTASQKVSIANLPVLSSPQLKLISRTDDGGANSYFCTNTNTSGVSLVRGPGTSTTVTVSATSHGLSSGDIVIFSKFTDTKYNIPWAVIVTGTNTFIVTIFAQPSLYASSDSGGVVRRVISVAATTTSVDITSTARDDSFIANQPLGLAATSTSLANPGYQFYVSLYNRTGGGHVGNRVQFGFRFTLTVRSNLRFSGLPDLSAEDSEWEILIGRTGDGGEVPYVSIDGAGNFISIPSGIVSYYAFTAAAIDGTKEMPINNGVIPAGLNMFCTPGDHVQGAIAGRPTIYISGSEADSTNGDFVGDWAQSWSPKDIETFPSAQGVTGTFEVEGEGFWGTKNHGAILSDVTGIRLWRGPWYGAGMAGIRSWCDTPYGNFWVTGHKQVATLIDGVPAPVSDEYEAALLSRIGDAYLSQTEMAHISDVAKRINHILIKCRDANGNPFEVIHDFRLRDGRSPQGQGYEFSYSIPLNSDFTLVKTRTSSGLDALWAGANTGQLYQLHSGANDAGVEYSADALLLFNAGSNKVDVPWLRWYGDGLAIISRGNHLNSTLDANASTDLEVVSPQNGTASVVAGDDSDFHWEVGFNDPESKNVYIRIQLTSHSADGNLDLNSVPHIPLENYGRVYMSEAVAGKTRPE